MSSWSSFDLQGCIFDLDGTLLDSIPFFYQVLTEEFAKKNIEITEQRREVLFLKSLNDDISKPPGKYFYPKIFYKTARRGSLGRLDALEFTKNCLQTLKRNVLHADFFSDALILLKYLNRQKIPSAIVSNTSTATIELLVEKEGLFPFFKVIIGRDKVKKQKPYPEGCLKAAQELGIQPEKCLMVGDLPLDILAGQRAGMKTTGILTGMSKLDYFPKYQPDIIVENLQKLKILLKYQYFLRG